jgi:methionyl aminopeptidase
MSIISQAELEDIKKISEILAYTLREMKNFAKSGISILQLGYLGGEILNDFGANSAPYKTYQFPEFTCISVENEFCHGIHSSKKILKEGDLINIDVSAELNGFWADNGDSFVLGEDFLGLEPQANISKELLHQAIRKIKRGLKISDMGYRVEQEAKKRGYKVVKNLTGHGVGRSLHENQLEIPNFKESTNTLRLNKNSVVATETFIATHSTYAQTLEDGWTMVGNKDRYIAQHVHTILITDQEPIILTVDNQNWN